MFSYVVKHGSFSWPERTAWNHLHAGELDSSVVKNHTDFVSEKLFNFFLIFLQLLFPFIHFFAFVLWRWYQWKYVRAGFVGLLTDPHRKPMWVVKMCHIWPASRCNYLVSIHCVPHYFFLTRLITSRLRQQKYELDMLHHATTFSCSLKKKLPIKKY